MEDTLWWSDEQPNVAHSDVCVRAMAAGARPLVDEKERPPGEAFRYPVAGAIRFVIPPAIAAAVLLVAVVRNFDCGFLGVRGSSPDCIGAVWLY